MLVFIIRRILLMIPTVFVISVISFAIIELPPVVNVAADGAPPHFTLCHFATSLALEGVVISAVAGMPVTNQT